MSQVVQTACIDAEIWMKGQPEEYQVATNDINSNYSILFFVATYIKIW